jgi:hypothetical protein
MGAPRLTARPGAGHLAGLGRWTPTQGAMISPLLANV